ncbi:MAG: hypothetical protein ACP5F9_01915 [Thiomonas sp.]|jgi:hypothetical protein
MGTKIYLAILGIALLVCLAIGFSLGYGHVFRAGADSVPGQDSATTPALQASSPAHSG